MRVGLKITLLGALALLCAGPVHAEELNRHFTVAGTALSLANVVGEVRVEPASGADFEIDVAVRGKDAGPDLLRFDYAGGAEAHFHVQYPIKKERTLVYPEAGYGSNSSFDAPWGTAYGESDPGDRPRFIHRDRQVRIRSHGRGLEVWADLTVRVPSGGELQIRHGAGKIDARAVQGDLVLDSCIGPVEAEGIRGSLSVDTGSGEVTVRDTAGDLNVDTGSGAVHLTGCRGGRVSVDTGSGEVEADAIEADRLLIDTGSGSVRVALDRMGKGSFVIDTGSGSIDLRIPREASAEIQADTGSGEVALALDQARLRRHSRDEVVAIVGDGEARVRLDTGSGSIQVTQ